MFGALARCPDQNCTCPLGRQRWYLILERLVYLKEAPELGLLVPYAAHVMLEYAKRRADQGLVGPHLAIPEQAMCIPSLAYKD